MNGTAKQLKGEKYIYLLMAYKLCQQNKDKIAIVGNDNGMRGGQNYYRTFKLIDYNGRMILQEKKNGANFADYSRYFEVIGYQSSENPSIYEHIENGENASKTWVH